MENRIKDLIKKKGFTQEQFAQKMGVSRMSLVKTLSGNPSYETFQRIASALEVEVWELFKSKTEIVDEILEEKKNTITCPKCGARFELKEE